MKLDIGIIYTNVLLRNAVNITIHIGKQAKLMWLHML